MPEFTQSVPATNSHPHVRPALMSFDSGEECSFQHWVEVCSLVDEAERPEQIDEMQLTPELERAIEETMLEVEPSTAYQHFAGDIV